MRRHRHAPPFFQRAEKGRSGLVSELRWLLAGRRGTRRCAQRNRGAKAAQESDRDQTYATCVTSALQKSGGVPGGSPEPARTSAPASGHERERADGGGFDSAIIGFASPRRAQI